MSIGRTKRGTIRSRMASDRQPYMDTFRRDGIEKTVLNNNDHGDTFALREDR